MGLSSFVGIWHALPIKDVIYDEIYFVGSVLRALENHTILPALYDVPYGTLTYFLNYILIAFFLLMLLPFFQFDVIRLKLFVLNSPDSLYLLPRLISSVLAIFFLLLVYKILKREISDLRSRVFLVIILFTNIVTALILHTGKMWVLSTLLVLASFYYLWQVIEAKEKANEKRIKKQVFLSIIFSFLAFSNFPLAFFSLINIPILMVVFRKRHDFLRGIIRYTLVGFLIYIIVTLLNFGSIKNQILSVFYNYRPIVGHVTITASLLFNFLKVIFLFPLMLGALALVIKNKIRNKRLFVISLIYFGAYFLLISVIATWLNNFQESLRYLFPLGFFLIFIIASFNVNFSYLFYPIGLISLIYFILTLFYLSVPTTYNQAHNWLFANLNNQNTVIINRVAQLQIPKNKASYFLEKEESCSTRCHNVINYNLNDSLKPLIIDQFSREGVMFNKQDIYYVEETQQNLGDRQLIKTFKNNIDDTLYYSVDYNIGNYFDLNYFKIKNLGKNIYIYKKVTFPKI